MELAIKSLNDILIVEVSGAVDSYAAGFLTDALVKSVAEGWTKLIVDVSRVERFTHAGARGLVVAAKLLRNARGALRICAATAPVEAVLRGLGFDHLLRFDRRMEESLSELSTAPNYVVLDLDAFRREVVDLADREPAAELRAIRSGS